MSLSYLSKDEIELTWLDIRDAAKLSIRMLGRKIENKVLGQLNEDFNNSVLRGDAYTLTGDEVDALIMKAAIDVFGEDGNAQRGK